ncbi:MULTISPECIES: MFS transporter [unclassified Jeotgalibaca]|uniref:MFS transporter n=1 Tax=unclassified Jeotgalibaca TaxID=2621505 RepID=UPI003FD2D835
MASYEGTDVAVAEKRPFGKRDVVGYFFGDLGCNFSFDLVTMYMFLYFTQHVGIRLEHYSLIILISKILDGINDPIIGAIIDRAKPKETGLFPGKFKPWILRFTPFLAFVAGVMFFDTAGMSYTAKILFCGGGYILWDLFYSFVNVPYGSLSSVMTTKQSERTTLSTARSIGGFVPNIVYGIFIPQLIYRSKTVDGVAQSIFQGEYLFPIAMITGVFALISIFIMLYNVEERVQQKEKTAEQIENYSFFQTLKETLKNRAMLGLVLTALAQIIFVNGSSQLTSLTYQLYFGDGSLNSLSIFATMVPMVIGATVGSKLVRRFGTREISSYPLVIAMAAFVFLRFAPISNPYVWWGVLMFGNIFAFGLSIYTWAMVSDVIDYQEYQTGERNEATVYSIFSMIRKIGQGVGQALVPLIIAFAIPGIDLSDAGTWTAERVVEIKNLSVTMPLVGMVLILLAMHFVYPLSKKKIEEVQVALGRTE